MVAQKPLVHLDSNIITGLVFDQVARDYVQNARTNGARILLSPSIIREMARTRKPRRTRLVEAAVQYCEGFTNLPFQDVLKLEIEAINAGELVPAIPILPIAELKRLLDDDFAQRTAGDFDPREVRRGIIEMYQQTVKDLRAEKLDPGFEAFLNSWSGMLFKDVLMYQAKKHGGMPEPKFRPDGYSVHHDKHAIATTLTLMAANMYRNKMGTMLKGEGCFTDIFNVMEIAHSDTLLTRDVELFECGKLAASVMVDFRPTIVLVPQP